MGKVTRAAALTGFVVLVSAVAQAQGFYNYTVPGGTADSAAEPFRPNYSSYRGFYMGPGGELQSGSVKTFSMNLGNGVSMGLVTSAPVVAGFSGLPGSTLVQGFPSGPNSANGLYLDPAMSTPWTTSGRLSVSLGGGLSWDLIGGVSRIPGNGFYFGPGGSFDNRTFTTVGTGFSFNFGRAGTLSLSGSVVRSDSEQPAFGHSPLWASQR
jgi:hypothetical protein